MEEDKRLKTLKSQYEHINIPKELDFAIESGIKKGKLIKRRKIMGVAAACALILVGGSLFFFRGSFNHNLLARADNSDSTLKTLPTIGTMSNLKKLLKEFNTENRDLGGNRENTAMGLEKPKNSNQDTGKVRDYSTTNNQVEGVEEGDRIITDGEYIYGIRGSGIYIAQAKPAAQLKIISALEQKDCYPLEMFVYQNKLVVIGRKLETSQSSPLGGGTFVPEADIYMGYGNTLVKTYDISDKSSCKIERTFESEGIYVSARLLKDRVYVITNKYVNVNWPEPQILPKYRDSASEFEERSLSLDKINYCPETVNPAFIIISSLSIANSREQAIVNSVMGSSESVYMSQDNLYVSGIVRNTDTKNTPSIQKTMLYRLALEEGKAVYKSSGSVPGYLLNQFSMDEDGEYFRVATTVVPFITTKGREGNTVSSSDMNTAMNNNLYVLNRDMKVVGKIENVAPGERIYSVRFMGSRAYMVTFKNTDPLFAIDLSQPSEPKILGELKIPGFSNYLHPYDDKHIIGFGMDTETIKEAGVERYITKGIKIALFDVSDMKNPRQLYTATIGGRGSYSELLNNHKALLFSREKNLLAFPVTTSDNNYQTVKTGAAVYNISLEGGITLKGFLSNQMKNSGYYYGNIERLIYIDNTLYCIGSGEIRACDLSTLKEIGSVELPFDDKIYGPIVK